MANKQIVPSMELNNAQMGRKIVNRPISQDVKRVLPENVVLKSAQGVADLGAKMTKKINDMKNKKQALDAAKIVQGYQQKLAETTSQEEFDEVVKKSQADLREYFNSSDLGKDFWSKHGVQIAEGNRQDVENLRLQKSKDWAKAGLKQLLATNQDMLARVDGRRGEIILQKGIDEIEGTDLWDDAQKQEYRNGYLKTGILNMALQDPDKALEMVGKFAGADEKQSLYDGVLKTKSLREEYLQKKKEREQNAKDMATYNRAVSLWQEKERGNISDAEFYVLTAENDKDVLWGESEVRSDTPMTNAYLLMKKLNNGEQMSYQDVREAGNNIISAYKNHKLTLEEASGLQTQLMLAQMDKSSSGLLFDKEVDGLIDKALLPDILIDKKGDSVDKEIMEQKAKFAFDVYDLYYSKKTAIADDLQQQGATLSPMVERKIRAQAFKETKEELGLKENTGDEYSVGELKRLANMYYTGKGKNELWKRFMKEAPYAEDKKALIKNIAMAEQRKELSYPRFETLEELNKSGLARGEKFYFKGRLSVRA